MNQILHTVKALLRKSSTTEELALGRGGAPSTSSLTLAALALGASYGACMGLYGLLRGSAYGLYHLVAVTLKVPALFLLTLLVTAPSLFVFSALGRSRFGLRQTARLLLAATTTSLAVLASFAPVTAFFTFSTKSHPFMQVLNTILFAIAGVVGLRYVHRILGDALPSAEGRGGGRRGLRLVFSAWMLIYAAVGAQMAWILRPLVGAPNLPQQLLRNTESNFIEGLLEALRYL